MQKGGKDAPRGDLESASVEELNQKITTLEKEKNKEEEYRNYMQLERVRSRAHSDAGRARTQVQAVCMWMNLNSMLEHFQLIHEVHR